MKPRRISALIPIIGLLLFTISLVTGAPLAALDASSDSSGTIVIEGPVSAMNINIITIANIVIELAEDDPLLTTIQVGDVVHVEGSVEDRGGIFIVVAAAAEASDSNIVVPVIQITGPVEEININIITIFNIDIQLSPDDPILATLAIGDILNVDGNLMSAGNTLVIVAVNVVVVDTADPEATPEATPDVGDDDSEADLPITIVIEGPVEAININVITIFGFNIEVDPEDPILTVIEIGDTIHIEGNTTGEGDTLIIVVVNITIINVEVYISDDGQAWRDSGNCSNGPPPWAPAHGWRRRCETTGNGGGGGRGSKRS